MKRVLHRIIIYRLYIIYDQILAFNMWLSLKPVIQKLKYVLKCDWEIQKSINDVFCFPLIGSDNDDFTGFCGILRLEQAR